MTSAVPSEDREADIARFEKCQKRLTSRRHCARHGTDLSIVLPRGVVTLCAAGVFVAVGATNGRQMDKATISRLSNLSLNDAAFDLWSNRHLFDQEEPPAPFKKQRQAMNRLMMRIFGLRFAVQRSYAAVKRDFETAPDGRTFKRMKSIFPRVADDDLKAAIRAAVKLDNDCVKQFAYSADGLWQDVQRAVALARACNPGFSEETYKRAAHRLAFDMR